jgi:ABC-type branched-subunit amino acid transport system ATPase component/ABC-type branched-subunit amino acid transport system permease subunit
VSVGSLILGLLNGMMFGLLGVGLVLVYKSNRFLNVAHAQMGTLSVAVLAKLVIDEHWNWWLAFVACVPIGIAVGMIVDRWVIRPLRERRASPVALLLVTIGVTQVLIGISALQFAGPDASKIITHGYPLPFHSSVRIGGVVLSAADLLAAVLVPLVVASLTVFLRSTMMGKSIRAAASNPDAARLAGVSIRRVSMVVWAIAGGLSAITAILQAPTQSSYVASSLGPNLLLLALGAAALGAFTSISLAMAGGILIGVLQQVTLAQTSNAAEAELLVFALIVAIVLIRGRAIGSVFAASGAAVEDRPPVRIPPAARDLPLVRNIRPLMVGAGIVVGVLLPLVPVLRSDSHRFELSLIMMYALVAISLTVAIGWAGQVSLGQFALVGAGAFVAGHLLADGWSLPFVLIPAGAVGAALLVLVGLPAVRVPGLTLALTTLGFALIGPDWLFRQSWFGSKQSFGLTLSTPALGRGLGHPGGQLVVYYFGLAVVVAAALAVGALRRSQAGRVIIAIRDNERAGAAFGVTPTTVKLAALSLSGLLAGAAGVIWADAWRTVSTSQFPPELSLTVLALAVIGGLGSVGGAVTAATIFYAATFFVSPHLTSLFGPLGGSLGFQVILGGVGLIATILHAPHGMAGLAQDWWQRRLNRMARADAVVPVPAARPTLAVRDVRLSFGGVVALDEVSIDVHPGEIVGLIGPNGAGKTTLLNVISGALQPSRGVVTLGAYDLSGMPPDLRAAFGLARSFQDAHLFPGLTVREVVQVAMASRTRSSMLASSVSAPWVRELERVSRRAADEIIDRLGLTPWADALTAELSTGTRRICDLAAQVAAQPSVLLLDEPTAGVAQREAEAFGPLLRRVRNELDCSVLIVEHDMPLLMGLCDRVYAMVEGQVIAEGTPEAIRNDPAVIASYLGTENAAIDRSNVARPRARRPLKAGAGAGQRTRRSP